MISEWLLDLFNDIAPDFGKPLRQFDYSTISDVILHVKYTPRENAGTFKNAAVAHLREYFSQAGTTHSVRLFSLRQEFPTQWHRFLNPSTPANGNVFEFEMSLALFPMHDAEKTLKINTLTLLARCTDAGGYGVTLTPPPPSGAVAMTLGKNNLYGGLHVDTKPAVVTIVPTDLPAKWRIRITNPDGVNLTEDPVKKVMGVEDMMFVVGYEWKQFSISPLICNMNASCSGRMFSARAIGGSH